MDNWKDLSFQWSNILWTNACYMMLRIYCNLWRPRDPVWGLGLRTFMLLRWIRTDPAFPPLWSTEKSQRRHLLRDSEHPMPWLRVLPSGFQPTHGKWNPVCKSPRTRRLRVGWGWGSSQLQNLCFAHNADVGIKALHFPQSVWMTLILLFCGQDATVLLFALILYLSKYSNQGHGAATL